jgi:hypothetical protein
MMRMTADKALALLPALQSAALALSHIESDATPLIPAHDGAQRA